MTKPKVSKRKTISIIIANQKRIDALYHKILNYVDEARTNVQRSIDTEMVSAYWLIGRDIIEEEQHGKKRANYGSFLLKSLAERLTKKYGRGFSISTLRDIRQFYLVYSDDSSIHHAPRGELEQPFSTNLGWIHYRALMRIQRPEARRFYEIEAEKNYWSGRQLERQIDSLLFECLAKSKDKKGLMRLACKAQEIIKAEDVIKDPLILEFLDLPESHRLVESKLENALIDNLQQFLLELGKGFAFVARQNRITTENNES